MKKPKRITAALLKEMRACSPAVRDFRRQFPRGTAVTRKTLEAYLRRAKVNAWEGRFMWMHWFMNQLGGPYDGSSLMCAVNREVNKSGTGGNWRAVAVDEFLLWWEKSM